MAIDKSEFIRIFDLSLRTLPTLIPLSSIEKDYIRDKAEKAIDLLLELEMNGFLIPVTTANAQQIQAKLSNLVLNNIHVNGLYQTFIKMIENHTVHPASTTITLHDSQNNPSIFTVHQMIIQMGWAYCSFCEVLKIFLSSIIDFSNLGGREPSGLGDLIRIFNNGHINNLSFFDDIDTKVRNSFFHLDFTFLPNGQILCDNRPSIYHGYSWRSQADNAQSEYIVQTDLIQLVLNGDRSSYGMISAVTYYIKKSLRMPFP